MKIQMTMSNLPQYIHVMQSSFLTLSSISASLSLSPIYIHAYTAPAPSLYQHIPGLPLPRVTGVRASRGRPYPRAPRAGAWVSFSIWVSSYWSFPGGRLCAGSLGNGDGDGDGMRQDGNRTEMGTNETGTEIRANKG